MDNIILLDAPTVNKLKTIIFLIWDVFYVLMCVWIKNTYDW